MSTTQQFTSLRIFEFHKNKYDNYCTSKSNFKGTCYFRLKGKLNTVARDYVLPDYTQVKRGYVRPQEETTGRAHGDEQVQNFRWC